MTVETWGNKNPSIAQAGVGLLTQRLAESDYLAGGAVSIADTTALRTLDFAAFVSLKPLAGRPHLAGPASPPERSTTGHRLQPDR